MAFMAKFALRAKSVGDWASSIMYLTGFASRNAALRGVTILILRTTASLPLRVIDVAMPVHS